MIKPGDHIDVIATFDAPAITITLFQDVLILAVGQEMVHSAISGRSGGAAAGKTDVTLALSPQEVQILTVAMKAGQIIMTLRPQMERGEAVASVNLSNLPPVIDFNTLLQLYIRRPPTKPQINVEVIRGLEKEFTPIPEGK